MTKRFRIFSQTNQSRGGMLIELLLGVALTSVIIPFIFRYQQNAVTRAQNIAITEQMSDVQAALERYIIANREELLKSVGRTITRISVSDLATYGVPDSVLMAGDDVYQLRILKSSDYGDQSTLQGVVVRNSDDITPLRTREIVNLSGGSMGFIDGTHAYGTFGTWHTDAVDIGIDMDNAIVETTPVNRDNALYLWRVPSDDASDSRMMTALHLGGHDILNSSFVNADHMEFTETLTAPALAGASVVFQNRTTINWPTEASTANVSGMLSADSKNMELSDSLTIADVAKLSSLTASDLWVNNLTLGGLSLHADAQVATLSVTQALDMTAGRIEAMFVSVGFAGSMTPRLVVYDRIEDSTNSGYYWDLKSETANFADATLVELNRMATLASYYEGDASTESGQIFGTVSANKNATVSDYMNAINEIQTRVRAKYRQLNLQ